MYITITVKDRN